MKIYLRDIVNRYKKHSKRLDDFSLLVDQPWITQSENSEGKCVYIFRAKNKELVILINGVVEKEDENSTWDYIGPMNSLLIKRNGETRLYNQGFIDDSVMILKLDSTNQFILFANKNKIETTVEKLLEHIDFKYSQFKNDENLGKKDKFSNSIQSGARGELSLINSHDIDEDIYRNVKFIFFGFLLLSIITAIIAISSL